MKKKTPIPGDVDVTDLIISDCDIPIILIEFYVNIKDPKIVVLAISFVEDIIYAVYRGRVKTLKYITLRITLKGLTSSKRLKLPIL